MFSRLLLLALLLPLLPLAAFAAPSTPPARKDDPVVAQLRADSRLNKSIPLALSDRSLGEALPELGKALGVSLTADRSVADDQVTLFCKERPARDLLPLLASHFGFLWRRKGDGYQLWQDLAGQQREATLRQAEVQGLLGRMVAHLGRVAAAARLTLVERTERKKAIQEALGSGKLSLDEFHQVGLESMALDGVDDPFREAGSAVLQSLTPLQVRALTTGEPLILSTVDGTLAAPFARNLHLAQVASRPDSSRSGPATTTSISLQVTDNLGAPMQSPFQTTFSNPEPILHFRSSISSSYAVKGESGLGGESNGWDAYPADPRPETAASTPDAPELLQEVELVRKPRRGLIPISRVAELIHEATGIPVLADSFIRARVREGVLAGKQPLYQVLRNVGQPLHYQWELKDGVLLFRSATFFRDHPREVPLRLRTAWRERMMKNGTLSLNEMGEIAGTLTDQQLRSLASYWYWQFEVGSPDRAEGNPVASALTVLEPPDDLVQRRHDLRLWHSLNAAQQKVARDGTLPLRVLNRVQQHLALTAYGTSALRISPDPATPQPSLEELAAGSFSVSHRADRMYQNSVLNADGSVGGTSQNSMPITESPLLQDGQRLRRTTQLLDGYEFLYSAPGYPKLAFGKALSVAHLPEVVK